MAVDNFVAVCFDRMRHDKKESQNGMSRKSSKKIAPSPAAQSSEQIDPSGMSVHATAAQISDAVRIG